MTPKIERRIAIALVVIVYILGALTGKYYE